MTIIQPNKTHSFLTAVIICLIIALVAGSVTLVALYNRLVNLNHGISDFTAELNKLKTASAETKDAMFSLFNSKNVEKLTAERQLVKDRTPQYLEIAPQPTAPALTLSRSPNE